MLRIERIREMTIIEETISDGYQYVTFQLKPGNQWKNSSHQLQSDSMNGTSSSDDSSSTVVFIQEICVKQLKYCVEIALK